MASMDAPGVILPFQLERGRVWRLLVALAVVSVVLLVGTGLAQDMGALPGWVPYEVRFLIVQSNVATEGVLGVWFASLLFFLTVPAALACFAAEIRAEASSRSTLLAIGWLGVAALAVVLSMSEHASLHEASHRVLEHPLNVQGYGWIGSLAIPVALVGVALLWFAWRLFRESRPAFWLTLGGVVLFLTVPAQELLESLMLREARASPGPFRRPIGLTLLEEGSEMLGAILIFGGAIVYFLSRLDSSKPRDVPHGVPSAEGMLVIRPRILVIGVVGAVVALGLGMGVMGVVEETLFQARRREVEIHAAAWFPAVLATLTGVIALYCRYGHRHLAGEVRWPRPSLLLAGLFSLVVGANYGADYAFTDTLWEGNPRWQTAVDLAFIGATLAVAGLLWRGARPAVRLAITGWAVLLIPTFLLPPGLPALVLGFVAFACLLWGLTLRWIAVASLPLVGTGEL